jgi:hypothetical protein
MLAFDPSVVDAVWQSFAAYLHALRQTVDALRQPHLQKIASDQPASGGSGIRTHGGLHLTAFQEPRICPLCHPSRSRSG